MRAPENVEKGGKQEEPNGLVCESDKRRKASKGTAVIEDMKKPMANPHHNFCKPHPYSNKGAYGFHFVKGI